MSVEEDAISVCIIRRGRCEACDQRYCWLQNPELLLDYDDDPTLIVVETGTLDELCEECFNREVLMNGFDEIDNEYDEEYNKPDQ